MPEPQARYKQKNKQEWVREVHMRIRLPTTAWGKLILVAYVLSIVFSLVAVWLTVYAMENWTFIYELDQSTRVLFTYFGLYGGAFLLGLQILISTLALPLVAVIVLLCLSRDLDPSSFIQNTIVCLCSAFIDGWALAHLAASFLDMFNDILILNIVINDNLSEVLNLVWFQNVALSIGWPAFLVSLALSFTFRFRRYLRSRNDEVNQTNPL